MTTSPKPVVRKLEDEPLWREANEIATYIYDKSRDFPDSETWHTAARLRSAAVDMFYVAEALGGTLPSTTVTDWSFARKTVAALRMLYTFSAKQDFVELEPEIVVRLNRMLKTIEEEAVKADEWARNATANDLDLWLEKYKIWKKIDDK